MLGNYKPVKSRALQGGVVLFMALIVLVLMTLGTIAMMRSVDTTNVIAGNLAFKQAAAQSGDAGVEAAINWLQTNAGPALWINNYANGYSATRQDPGGTQTWDQFWSATVDPSPSSAGTLTCSVNGIACTLPTDAAGNTVTYTISRMCALTGDPNTPSVSVGCPTAPVQAAAGSGSSNQGSGQIGLKYAKQYYYRITVRVVGPRNTVGYIQSMVAI
jgi:type IV pilus assembly protein PilX